jgi:transposase
VIKPVAGYRPLAYPSPEAVQTTGTVAFRKGADSLAALAKETLGQDPFSGAVLVP